MIPKPGMYKHYKGGLYVVVGVAQHTEKGEQFVIYYPKRFAPPEMSLYARPLNMFSARILHKKKLVPRFRRLTLEDLTT